MKPHSAPGGQSLKTEHRKKLSHFIAEKQGRNKKKEEKQKRKKGISGHNSKTKEESTAKKH